MLVSTLADCPHGTEYGYVEFYCRCIDLGPPIPNPDDPTGPPIRIGCRQAGVQASSNRRRSIARNAKTPSTTDPIGTSVTGDATPGRHP